MAFASRLNDCLSKGDAIFRDKESPWMATYCTSNCQVRFHCFHLADAVPCSAQINDVVCQFWNV